MIIFERIVDSDFQNVDVTVKEIIEMFKNSPLPLSHSSVFKIAFALREILNNAVEHGNHFDKDKSIYCQIEYDTSTIKLRVKDQGSGIKIGSTTVQLAHEKSEDNLLRERNRGLEIIGKMGFKIEIYLNQITLSYNINEEVLHESSQINDH